MQILKLELENIKSYTSESLSFTEGVNAIVGHNGAGKSTILEAIGFALFDRLAYTAGEFLREGTRTGAVAVTFQSSADDRIYRVERRLGGSHLYVVHDPELGVKLCEGKADVLAFVRRHSGADPTADLGRLFGDAIGVAQGTLTAIFLQTPALRKTAFDTLLQVDEYKTAFDRLLEPRALLREQQQQVSEEVAVLTARLERLPQLEAAATERAAALEASRTSLAETETRLTAVTARRQGLEAARAILAALELRKAQLGERLQTLAEKVVSGEQALAAALEAQALVAANEAGYSRYLAAQTEKNALERQLQRRQRLLAEQAAVDKALALCEAEARSLEEGLAAVAQAEQTLAALAPAVARQAALEVALAEAQQAARQLADAERQVTEQQEQRSKLEERRRLLEAQLARAETVRASLLELEGKETAARLALDAEKSALATWRAEADALKKQVAALENVATAQCPVCEQPLTAEHRQRMLARNDAQLVALRQEYALAQEQVKQEETALGELARRLRALREEMQRLPRAGEWQEVTEALEEADVRLMALRATAQALAPAPQQSASLEEELQRLDNPRQQSAIAGQQAGRREALEAARTQVAERRAGAVMEMQRAEEALAAFAELDTAVAAAAATLVANESAYQLVLGRRQQAEGAEQARTQVARLQLEHGQAAENTRQIDQEIVVASGQFDPAEYTGILSEEYRLRGEEGALQSRIQLLEAEAMRLSDEVNDLRGQQAVRVAKEALQKRLAGQESALDAIRQYLRQSGPFVTQAVIRQISAGAAQFFGELMQDYSRQLSWNEDYGITLEVDGATRQYAQLSGGEQMSAALAVRLALVREMSNTDIAFFDEPTANLDDVRREALARQIMNVKGFRQLFVISHDDTFEQATQNLIRVNRNGSISKIASATAE